MEFTLYYKGNLRPNGSRDEKHRLRKCFHPQIRALRSQLPLSGLRHFLEPASGPSNISVLRQAGAVNFAPLVCQALHLIAEIDLLVLWPESPGNIITSGGDIDNRIKTLLDALKVPSEPGALPDDSAPTEDEQPFFCLLEDDHLVTRLSIETDRLLEPSSNPSEVVLIIRVKTTQLQVLVGTVGLS